MLTIRNATPADLDEIISMCIAHAKFEGAELALKNDFKVNLASLIFNDSSLICIVAENEKGLMGYATCTKQYATWTASAYLYMDCLFLQEEVRGMGVGSAFMTHIADYMRSQGLSEIQWQTPATNHSAISFYTKIGAKELSKSRFTWTP